MILSQSELHRSMVQVLVMELTTLLPNLTFIVDVQEMPGDTVPPLLGGFRPDVVGVGKDIQIEAVAEAKTDFDLESPRSHAQIFAFLDYLESLQAGLFVLAVTGGRADRAKTMLRFLYSHSQIANVKVSIFDGQDFWILEPKGCMKWHLG